MDEVEFVGAAVCRKRRRETEDYVGCESESDKSLGLEFVDVNLVYELGLMVEVVCLYKFYGVIWVSVKVIENDGEFITFGVASEGGGDGVVDNVCLFMSMLLSIVCLILLVDNLVVDVFCCLNEEVDVYYNNRWCEGYIF